MTPPAAGAPERRKDASMTLLVEVMRSPLDPGYAAAAERRRQLAIPAGRGVRGRSALAIGALLLIGVLLATAWWQARGTRPAGVQARERLIAEIAAQDAAASRLQRSITSLTAQIEAERRRQLELSAQGGLADEVALLGRVTGALAVSGPGVVVTMDDAKGTTSGPGNDPRNQQNTEDGKVLDSDLQIVVNGLWQAGAEAIAINGQRLTALSAIRSAGQAILVDYRPLSPPYRISAIGDPATLQPRFSNGPGGRDVQYLKDNFGVQVDLRSAKVLMLPASAGLDTRRATVLSLRQGAASTEAGTPSARPKSTTSRPQETP